MIQFKGTMYLVERRLPQPGRGPILEVLTAPGHKFPDAVLTFTAAGTQPIAVPIPRVAGMTELVVNRARMQVLGAAVVLPDVGGGMIKSADRHALGLPASALGSLVRLKIKDLAPSVPNGKALILFDDAGAHSWSWSADSDGKVTFARDSGSASKDNSPPLHVLLRPGTAPAQLAPPARAVPYFNMPNNGAGLYSPILAGAQLKFDSPSQGWLTIELDPPLDARWVEIFLGSVPQDDAHGGMPNDAAGVSWTASEIDGVWQTGPRDVKVTARLSSDETLVAQLPGELTGARLVTVDFTPGARSLVNSAYKSGSDATLALALDVTTSSAGKLTASELGVDAEYRFAAVPKDGQAVALRGDPVTVALPLPGPFTPARFELTIDGRFGLGALVQAADVDLPPLRSGFRVGGDGWTARRIALARDEINLRLLRVGLLGRASGPTELLVSLHHGDDHHVGAQLGKPVTISVTPSVEAAWQRVELPDDPSLLPHPPGVWIVARAPRGTFWWYGDPRGDVPTQVSSDGGASWNAIVARPLVQLHKQMPTPSIEPLVLRLGGQTLLTDVLAAPARVSRVQVVPAAAAAAATRGGAAISALGVRPEDKTSATFRLEGVAPLGAAALAALAAQTSLPLSFSSRRDVDFRVLDALFTYDPWTAKGH